MNCNPHSPDAVALRVGVGGIDGVLAVRDGGNVKDGIRLAPLNTSTTSFHAGITHYSTGRGQRVVAGVIAERAFVAQRFGRVNVAFFVASMLSLLPLEISLVAWSSTWIVAADVSRLTLSSVDLNSRSIAEV